MIRREFKKTGRELKQMLKVPVRLHKIRRCRVARWSSLVAAFVTLAVQLIPLSLQAGIRPKRIINWNQGLKDGLTQTTSPELRKLIEQKRIEREKQPDVRELTGNEMSHIKGAGPYRNKYFLGSLPWQRSLRDVNLNTGNLFKSFTDVQVAPARGAGLALQRTYNSNDDREGPFGTGWTHAYDIRMQEEANTAPSDETVNLADRADFFGGEHKYHRDADGLYTPPAYLYDEMSSDYEKFLTGDPIKVAADTETDMDGTVKHFIKGATGVTNPERVCDSITDRYGNTTTLAYSNVSLPGGVTKKYLWTVTDPSGRTLTFTWTNLGTSMAPVYRITQVDGPLYSVTYAYYTNPSDPASYMNLHTVTLDPGGLARTTTFTYTSVTHSGTTENGLLASISDPLSHTVSYTYGYDLPNGSGGTYTPPTSTVWVTSVSEPSSGGSHTFTISPGPWTYLGTFTTGISSNGGIKFRVETDSSARYAATDQGTGLTYSITYDSANNVTRYYEPQYSGTYPWPHFGPFVYDHGTQTTYGPHGNVLTSYPLANSSEVTTTTYYNASQYFQKASVTDPMGRVTTFGVGTNTDSNVGNRGSVLWVRDAGYSVSGNPSYHKQVDYTYNSYGQKTSETNMNGVVTNSSYGDTWGNLTQVVQDPHVTMGDSHLARTTSMTYNAGGQMTASIDALGQSSSFTYNVLGQPTQASFPATASTSAETVSYTYGSNGRMNSVTDNRGTTSLSYETGNDRVASTTDPVTGAVSYTYGIAGERRTMSLPGGGTWNYAYGGDSPSTPTENTTVIPKDDPNSAGRMLTQITDDQGRIVNYRLDLRGHLHECYWNQVFDVSGALQTYCYSYLKEDVQTSGYGHGWITEVQNLFFSKTMMGVWNSTVLTQNDYNYNASGMRTSNQISDSGGVVRTESYGYDEQSRLTSVNYGDSHTQSYTFDSMGNRATKVNDGTTESYNYNAGNMLVSRGSNSYTNDADGNTLTGGGRTNTWDSQNRLYQCVNGSTTTVNTYASDGLRHRSASTTSGVTTTRDSVLDSSKMIREQTPVSGTEVNVATFLVGGRGLEYRRDDSSGAVRWYCYDGLGSVLGEVNSTGTLTATRSYDVYGGVRTSAGTSTSKHKFVGALGHPSEDETGLIYMRARYMDPVAGRFVAQDSKQNGNNWFAYCCNDPVNYTDETGKAQSRAACEIAILLGELLGALEMAHLLFGLLAPVVAFLGVLALAGGELALGGMAIGCLATVALGVGLVVGAALAIVAIVGVAIYAWEMVTYAFMTSSFEGIDQSTGPFFEGPGILGNDPTRNLQDS